MPAAAADYCSTLIVNGNAVAALPTDVAAVDGYEALNSRGKRRLASGRIQREDLVLNSTRRRELASNALDLHRNFALAAWTIRRHLDYTTLFDFHPATGDEGLDDDLRYLMARDSRPANCEIGGRHSWNRFRRLAEVLKILHGDVGIAWLRSGHVQGIESHLIKSPETYRRDADRWENGVKLGVGRRAAAYCVRERRADGTLRERVLPASQLHLLAAFEGRFDQVRGISSFAGALNDFRDIAESLDYMRERLKLDQIFSIAFFREPYDDQVDDLGNTTAVTETTDADTGEDLTPPPTYKLGQGVTGIDMDVGESVQTLQSNNPSSQTQQFLKLAIRIALASLDIPSNLLHPDETNYSGHRAAWIGYERACVSKREDQLALHDWMTRRRIARWMLPPALGGTGEIVLPRSLSPRRSWFRWTPRGTPWWKPSEELTTDLMAAAAGLKTFQTICDEHGLGLYSENVRELRREFDRAKRDGATLAFNPSKLPMAISFDTEFPGAAA